MFSHEPLEYSCPMCTLVNGFSDEYNKQEDIVFQNETTLAYVSPKWWMKNKGNVIVIPKKHVENIYVIPDQLLSDVYATVKKVSLAIKKTYQCDGISTRQHNEPAGNQDVWHFHVHVFPRYEHDELYKNHDEKRWVSHEEKLPYVKKLKKYLDKNLV